jgi:hypothetical protein
MPDNKSDSKENMERLARKLALNYFHVSGGSEQSEDGGKADIRKVFGKNLREELGELEDPDKRYRNIVVVGAGASFGSFGGTLFPTAKYAIERLKERLKFDDVIGLVKGGECEEGSAKVKEYDRGSKKTIVDLETRRFKELFRVNEPEEDFESQLAILSSIYTEERLRDELAGIYGRRHHPHLVFSIIAHLFKHRFVDVIINYNFDELLDQAIEEELGNSQYFKILSDGDCADLEEIMVENRLKVPIYIKPHGTFGHKSTLRFTKDDYLGLPGDMYQFMESIIKGDTGEGEGQFDIVTNLITIGFSMKSLEMNRILRSLKDAGSIVNRYHISASDPENGRFGDVGGENRLIDVDDFEGLGETIDFLWKEIKGLFSETKYMPRDIHRDRIVHALLHDGPLNESEFLEKENEEGTDNSENHWTKGVGRRVPAESGSGSDEIDEFELSEAYFKARFYVEIAIALMRGNGRIDLPALADGRVGMYFENLRRAIRRKSGEERAVSLEDLLKAFDLKPLDGYSGNVLTLPRSEAGLSGEEVPKDRREDLGDLSDFISDKMAKIVFSKLEEALKNIGSDELDQHLESLSNGERDRVIGWMKRLFESDVNDVTAHFTYRHLLPFTQARRANVLHTNLAMTLQFMEEVEKHEHELGKGWNVMLAISETGKIVAKMIDHLEQYMGPEPDLPKVLLITANPASDDILDKRIETFQKKGILVPFTVRFGGDRSEDLPALRLPYWAHNHHMVLFARAEGEKIQPVSGISFAKQGLQNRVNPIFSGQNPDSENPDLTMLANTFFAYAQKSLTYYFTGSVPDVRKGEDGEGDWKNVERYCARAVRRGEGDRLLLDPDSAVNTYTRWPDRTFRIRLEDFEQTRAAVPKG